MVTFWSAYLSCFSGWSSSRNGLAGLCFAPSDSFVLKRRCVERKGSSFFVGRRYAKGSGSRIAPTPQAWENVGNWIDTCQNIWWQGLGGNPYVQSLRLEVGTFWPDFCSQRWTLIQRSQFFLHSSRLLPNYVAINISQPTGFAACLICEAYFGCSISW